MNVAGRTASSLSQFLSKNGSGKKFLQNGSTSTASSSLSIGGIRSLTSVRNRDPNAPPRRKPWPYQKWNYSEFWQMFDRTTTRFDENTKLVVIEGAHAIGKSELAQYLAKEFDFKYFPPPNVNKSCFFTQTGVDMREYNEFLTPRNQPFAEPEFFKNPLGGASPGAADRFHLLNYALKVRHYTFALQHIFNTGQGVVLEQSPFADPIYLDAAYNAGWISKEAKREFYFYYTLKEHQLMRPNLIIYLDADVNTVQKNIQARNNEWDKDSAVWNNSQYLNDIYSSMKNKFLPLYKDHCLILGYDWSNGGDMDLVSEDIERLNFDWYDMEDQQQSDWRLYTEDYYDKKRLQYSEAKRMEEVLDFNFYHFVDAPTLRLSVEDVQNQHDVLTQIPEEQYEPGYNPYVGDKVLFKLGYPNQMKYRTFMYQKF